MNILANDGIIPEIKQELKKAGFVVWDTPIPQNQLSFFINENNIKGLLIRSATKVNAQLIQNCPNLEIVIRGGVGLDNVDLEAANKAGVKVYNTPGASTNAVAELTIAHLLSLARFVFESNRQMPFKGNSEMKELKKQFSKGIEIEGKTLGIIGLGRIGQAVAQKAALLGMKVIATNRTQDQKRVHIPFNFNQTTLEIPVECVPLKQLLETSDFITLHTPYANEPILTIDEFRVMKQSAILINLSRGGIVHEDDLIQALNEGLLARAALDVFINEPNPNIGILNHPKISLTPHIGASTPEAQIRIGQEQIQLLKKHFEI